MFKRRKGPEDFDLLIWEAPGEKQYRARVRDAESGGEAHAEVSLPFSQEELRDALWAESVCRDLKGSGPARDLPHQIGLSLFQSVFVGQILISWQLRRAKSAGKVLRLRLHLLAPGLWDCPWELLFDPAHGFLATLPSTPVLRYEENLEPIRPLRVKPPIRVLAVAAHPEGFSPLAFRDELEGLRRSLEDLQHAEWLELDILEGATRDTLRRKLDEKSFHILHFIGHGTFDQQRGGGVILLEGEAGGPDPMGAQELSVLLGAHPELRLVVLNVCHGAKGNGAELFSGLAQSLIQGGLPAVVAMQSAISDRAAILFSRCFYESLAAREPIDRAISKTRNAMFVQGFTTEWGSPVLATRSPDCKVFDLSRKEVATNALKRVLEAWRYGVAAIVIVAILVLGFRLLGRRWFDLNLVYASFNPPECPSPRGLSIAFVKVTPDPPLQPFCIGRFEVTQRLWTKVMGKKLPSRRHGSGLPVVRVSWEDTSLFLARLEKREPGGRFRLPAGKEWTFAAQAGEKNPPEASFGSVNCKNKEENDGYEATAPVGFYPANGLGLFDMLGNASEWVSDEDIAMGKRIRRGGGFNNALRNCSVAYISSVQPDFRYDDAGFRVVRDPVK